MPRYPCSTCHSKIEPRTPLTPPREPHGLVRISHGETLQNCYQCHRRDGRNQLVLFGGQAISFDESHRLCGQCHGLKARDWKAGIHGKQVGGWQKGRERLTCTACHDAHAPAPKQVDVVRSGGSAPKTSPSEQP